MRKIYSSPTAAKVQVARELLAANGIKAVVQHETFSILGWSYSKFMWPSLWVGDADEGAAREALKDFDVREGSASQKAESWTCPKCGEVLGGQFSACWKCAAAAQPKETPAASPELVRSRRGLFSALVVMAAAGFVAALAGAPQAVPGLIGILLARFQVIALLLFIIGGLLSLHFLTEVFSAEGDRREEVGEGAQRGGSAKLARIRRDLLMVLLLVSGSPVLAELSEQLWGSPDAGLALGLSFSLYFFIKVVRALRAK